MEGPRDDGAAALRMSLEDELRAVNERLLLSILREQESLERVVCERRQLDALLEALHDGVVITDGGGSVVMLNDAARRILDVAPDVDLTRVGAIAFDHRRPDMTVLPRHEHPLVRATGGEIFTDAEVLLVHASGEVRRLITSCTNTTEDGKLTLAITVLRDVTERRALEVRLSQTERLASIGTLAAGVAHEINNPLAFVTTNVALVLEEVRALELHGSSTKLEDLEVMLRDVSTGAERIETIVRGLETFSRENERPSAVVNVRSVLDLSIDLTNDEIRRRARLVRDYGDVPLVRVDEARLGQVFFNLLVNAAHALPEGDTDRNEIRVVTSTDSTGRAVIEIRDSGPGIPDDVLPRIFDPFFTTKPEGIGTGLGLSICRNSVLAMQGEIAVESRPGSGTVVRVLLPPSRRAPEPTASPTLLQRGPASRGVVLVVDDEPAIGAVLTRVLRDHDVTVVTSAKDALDLIATGRSFDVILSDLMMPGKSGMDLFDTLSECSPRHAEKIVFVSGGAFTPGAAAFLERVPNERIRKPFEANSVRALVQRYVGRT